MTKIMDTGESEQIPPIKNTAIIAIGVSVAVIALIILQHNLAFQGVGTIVLPAGGTYLGPTDTTTPAPAITPPAPVAPTVTVSTTPTAPTKNGTYTTAQGKFAVTKDAVWVTVKGNKYPYSFKKPSALNLVTFPNDQFDIYAISWNGQPPDQNVLIGVDNLNRTDALKQYIDVSKRTYVENWWKQFGLKGIGSITEFTNSHGLKGYRAKFLNSAGQTPNDDVFFETPNPIYVIHIASGVLDSSVFDPLIDSVAWGK